ncbi:CUE domain-containing protein [Smittium mucronatum]|uniref:RNA polymerase II degradation factor 1 n=1 Tax=Smittium mucronatum TaxID=133383 RepID=A0A1R0GLD4_9FUNG|nr:CUE domain-containing protein [Smittium mucronatum]
MSSIELPSNTARAARPGAIQNNRTKRGPARPHKTKSAENSKTQDQNLNEIDETSELKLTYKSQLLTLLEVFPNWTETDLIYALKDADGDLEITIGRISDGISCQWGEVKSRKDKKTEAKKTAKQSPRSNSVVVKSSSSRSSTSNQRRSHIQSSHTDSGPQSNSQNSQKVSGDHTSTHNKALKRSSVAPSKAPIQPVQAAPKDIPSHSSSMVPPSGGVSWAKVAKRAVESHPPAIPNIISEVENKPDIIEPITQENVPENSIPSPDLENEPTIPENGNADDLDSEASPDHTAEEGVQEAPKDVPAEDAPSTQPEDDEPLTTAVLPSDKPTETSLTTSGLKFQAEAVIMPPSLHNVDQLGLQFGSLSTDSTNQENDKSSNDVSNAPSNPTPSESTLPISEQSNTSQTSSTVPQTENKQQSNPASGTGVPFSSLQQQTQSQYMPGLLAMPQGPLPNDFGAAMLYGFDPQRAQMMNYYNENFSQNNVSNSTINPTSSSSKDDSNSTPSVGLSSTSVSGSSAIPNIPNPGQTIGNYPQQFQQPNNFQGLGNMPYYSPFYYNMGIMQPNSQYPNPNLGSNYSQHYMKQGMFPMYANNIPNMNMQQAQLQQLSILHQQLQMSQQQQQQLQNSQPGHAQQSKQAKPTSISSNTSQHVNLASQRGLSVGQYGSYGINNQQPGQGNISSFDQESQSQTQPSQVQQYAGFPNSQLPGYLNSPPKGNSIPGPGVVSSNPKEISSSNPKSAQPGLTSSQAAAAAVIGGTTFYQNPQQNGYSGPSSGSYPINVNQIQSPHQLYSNYGHNQQQPQVYSQNQPSMNQQSQQSQSLGQPQPQSVPQGVSQPQAQSLGYSQGSGSSAYSQQAQSQQSQQQQQQYHHNHSLHNSSTQQTQVQSQPGSYHSSYNQLRNNPPYWSGQN